jgi:hypothetical protein
LFRVFMKENNMKTIEYVGYSLMIVAYTILLIKNLELKVGLIVSISTIIAVFILKYLLINKKENDFEHKESIIQSVGNGARSKGDLTFEGITQDVDLNLDKCEKE